MRIRGGRAEAGFVSTGKSPSPRPVERVGASVDGRRGRSRTGRGRLVALVASVGVVTGCSTSTSQPSGPSASSAPVAQVRSSVPGPSAEASGIEHASPPPRSAEPSTKSGAEPGSATARAVEPSDAVYPWGPTAPPTDRLDQRFATPPAGFRRVAVEKGSFAAFLRTLPLKPEGAPVVDYRGLKLYDDGRHPNIVAVADLDVGSKDLQHCADVILRLHAEWRYGRGERDLVYRAVSGQALSYRKHMSGERPVVAGKDIVMKHLAAARKDDHALFRSWLDDVFSWAGTASIERDGKKVGSIANVQAGDFFVMSGTPFGHAVLVLDVAKDHEGRAALLLGQSYMPAQTFQVLRPAREDGDSAGASSSSAWFIVEPHDQAVATPFWRAFPIQSLRRL